MARQKRDKALQPHEKDSDQNQIPLDWFAATQAGDEKEIGKAVAQEIQNILDRNELSSYLTLLLYDDEDSISDYHADVLYRAASEAQKNSQDILLIIQSSGGRIEPAYLISKTLKRLSNDRFVVAVPRRAKSAATLISLGADEIHMGLMSQLGPIDPQFGGLPALALGNALDVIADLSSRFPAASDMLAKYLTENLSPRHLGYYQRVSESAVQYGERLLASKSLPNGKTAHQIADHLVNHYKDHGFVIDIDEAKEVLGDNFVREGTAEYKGADAVIEFLGFFGFILEMFQNKKFRYIDSVSSGLNLIAKPDARSTE